MKLSSSNHHGVTSAGVTSAEVTSTGNLVVNVGEEDEMKITGYKQDSIKNAVCWVLTVLSAGLLRLVFHWRPDWMLKFTAVVTTLDQAQNVLLEDQYGQKFVETVICVSESNSVSVIHKTSQRSEIVLSLRWTEQVCDPPVEEDTDQPLLHMKKSSKYFVNKMIKYFWTSQRQQFEKLRGLEEGVLCSFFHETKGLTETQQAEWRKIYGSNNISVHVTPIVKLLFTQVLNPFYIFQLFSCILWFSDQYIYYASCILVVSLLSIATQVYQTRSMQRALKSTIAPVELVNVFRIETGAFETVHSDVLVPGDIIEVPRHGCVMQCDAVLVNGNCIVNESMLTGESVPVTKTPIACHSAARDELSPATSVPIDATFQMNEHSRHVLFCGTHVIQTRYYGKQPVKAVVIRTGFSTAKGELVRSILFPKPVDFKFSQDGIKFMGFLAVIAVMGMMYTMILMIRRGEHAWLIIRRTLDLVTIIVPPALPAAMTIGVVFAQKRLARRNIFCISPRSINLCGAVNAFCFDKTGTLTEDGLDMWGVVPAYNSKFENEKKDVSKLNCRDRIVACMAACHSLTIVEEKITGDPLDVKMFEATDWVLEEPGDDSTKYDVITPTIVHPKNPDIVEISAGYESSEVLPYEIGILRQFTFSSKLQRMSVITRELSSRHFDLYAKGSPEMIVSLSKPETVPSDFHDVLMRYTEQGYRVIGLGHKELANMSYVKIQRAHRDLVEVGLTFLGLLVLENRLKIETTPVIRTLKEADIRALMITGDNMLTALSVARECEMIDRADRVVHVTVLPPTESQGACIEYTDNSINKVDGESIAIDMEPGNKVHFSITGNSWSLLRKFHPAVVQKLLVRGTVFARFSPEQKQQLIEALQNVGYYVGMCGDGANDCGALKTAHAGISLSEAEASVASPFTSKHANIECVPKLIMEGRAALVTSYGIFKFMAGYSMTQFLSVCLVYWIGANLTDFTFLYIDLPLLTTLGITFCYTEAYPILHRRPPKISLLALTPIISIILILFINVVAQVIVFIWVTQQPWFEEYTPVDEFDNRCFEVTAVFSISAFQYIGMAIIFSKGFPYRKNMFTNYLFLINLILCTLVTAIIVVHPPQFVADLLDLRLSPSISFRAMFLGLATINFLLSLLVEMLVIDQLIDNRLMQWWRKTVASKQVAYVCIEDELNRDANWPPISQGGKSLVDMMRLETNANSDDERLLPNSKASDSDREQATDSTESTSPEHISSCTPHPVIDCLSVKIMADNRANCDRSCIL